MNPVYNADNQPVKQFNSSLAEYDMPCLSSVDPDQFGSEEAN